MIRSTTLSFEGGELNEPVRQSQSCYEVGVESYGSQRDLRVVSDEGRKMKLFGGFVWSMIIVLGTIGGAGLISRICTEGGDPAQSIYFDGIGAAYSFPNGRRDNGVVPVEELAMNAHPGLMSRDDMKARGIFPFVASTVDAQGYEAKLVPDPTTVLLLGIGLLGFAIVSRKKLII